MYYTIYRALFESIFDNSNRISVVSQLKVIIKGIRVCLETKSEKEIKVSSVNTNICQVLAFFFVWADLFIDYLI